MNIQEHSGFYVAGVTARTNNAKEMSGNGKIGDVWETFLQPGLVVKIPHRIGVDLVAVYTDYENDHTGHYTYLLWTPHLIHRGPARKPHRQTYSGGPLRCILLRPRPGSAGSPGGMATHLLPCPLKN